MEWEAALVFASGNVKALKEGSRSLKKLEGGRGILHTKRPEQDQKMPRQDGGSNQERRKESDIEGTNSSGNGLVTVGKEEVLSQTVIAHWAGIGEVRSDNRELREEAQWKGRGRMQPRRLEWMDFGRSVGEKKEKGKNWESLRSGNSGVERVPGGRGAGIRDLAPWGRRGHAGTLVGAD